MGDEGNKQVKKSPEASYRRVNADSADAAQKFV
jgi:hypothetical protein